MLFVVTNNNAEAESWTLDVLISPTAKIVVVMFVDAVFLLILGLIIIVLHMYEKVLLITHNLILIIGRR